MSAGKPAKDPAEDPADRLDRQMTEAVDHIRQMLAKLARPVDVSYGYDADGAFRADSSPTNGPTTEQ
ncbi:hypothetical protein BDK92_7165 [Micromonospora pisi]|uniref:Uncharacterized protein n=1 Tax=Micromonospora pisi TaxID=589240 RepID=A0A495JUJ6_9ACTN|nr:hypothetical protein [Micromonospora pisi]RKR92687.1 hypothetical protein BDK92_7165 [Micromonospora pisi]